MAQTLISSAKPETAAKSQALQKGPLRDDLLFKR
jgi:hypothetical protein